MLDTLTLPARHASDRWANGEWSEEELDTLRRGVADGLSGSQIAAILPGRKRSRNAVISKCDRLELQLKGQGKYRPRDARGNSNPKFGRVGPTARAPGPPPVLAPTPVSLDQTAPPAGFRLVTLAEAGHKHCRWPVGDPADPSFRFCGLERVPGKRWPYCAHHQARARAGRGEERATTRDCERALREIGLAPAPSCK